jgi:hypothetical protein
MTGLASRLATGVACAALAATSIAVTGADDAPGATDWPSTNYDQTANRYSPLHPDHGKERRTLQQVWSDASQARRALPARCGKTRPFPS